MKLNLVIWLMVLIAELFWLWSILQQDYNVEGLIFLVLMIFVTIFIGIKAIMLLRLDKK